MQGDSGRRGKRRMSVGERDLDELYQLVQGAPFANTILDARASLVQREFDEALELIESARQRYEQANRRILRQQLSNDDGSSAKGSETQVRRQRQRQDRCQHVLAAFDDVLDTLRRMIRLRGEKGEPQQGLSKDPTVVTVAQLLDTSSSFRRDYAAARSTEEQAAVLSKCFVVKTVDSPQDLTTGALYYFQGKEQTYLVVLGNGEPGQESLPLRLALSGQSLKPILRSRFLESGRLRKLLRLVPRQLGDLQQPEAVQLLLGQSGQESSVLPKGTVVLDMGAFSQLHDAAIRTGLAPNADSIAHVRDREFRRGEYQKAFQVIEGLYGKFSNAATQREQRLRREDVDIASGRIKMSPKALLEKRARDTAQNQLIARARSRFLRVLEGLRVLMHQG